MSILSGDSVGYYLRPWIYVYASDGESRHVGIDEFAVLVYIVYIKNVLRTRYYQEIIGKFAKTLAPVFLFLF